MWDDVNDVGIWSQPVTEANYRSISRLEVEMSSAGRNI
jgi:hypothetical protein